MGRVPTMKATDRAGESPATEIPAQAVLAAVIGISDDAVFTCDGEGLVKTWSDTAERLFGCQTGDAIERPLELLFAEHLRHEVQDVIASVLAGDRIQHFQTEVLRPDGMPVPVSLSLCPIQAAAGRPVGSAVIVRDVTEQRLAQATLAEVEARLEESEALAHAGRWLWDLRTGAVQWSTEFHRIHGVDPLDFDGTLESHLEWVHPLDRDRVRDAMEQSVVSGRPFETEYRVVRPDREIRIVHIRAQPTMGSAGAAVGLRGIGQDVTDQA
jgi:PAS domain S-box-containing protein